MFNADGKVGPNEVVMLHIRLEFVENREAQQGGPDGGVSGGARTADEISRTKDGRSGSALSHDEL